MRYPSGAICLLLLGCFPVVAAEKPNVVFIFADDMGYGEIEALNPKRSKIPTPSLNQLAAEGMVFTDAHTSSSVCSPSRYSLLTGRYNWRTRLQAGVLTGGQEPLIAADRMTLGTLFGQQGYRTAIFGKWHLDYHYQVPDKLKNSRPKKTQQRYVAHVPIGTHIPDGPLTRGFDTFFGFHHARSMSSLVRDDKIVEEINVVDVLPRLTKEVVSYIDKHAAAAKSGKPFFLYFPLSSPHSPIVPAAAWKGKGKIGTYSDFVAQTDGTVGEVMEALDRNGLSDDTIVFFSTDNGTSKVANIPKLQSQGHYPSADLRGSKADLWDGGHRVPFIVRWPGEVKPKSQSDQLVCLSDMMATFAEYFSVALSVDTAEDSISFLPALLNRPIENPRTAIVHHSIAGHFSIRQDDWKLLLAPGSGGWTAPAGATAIKAGLPEMQLYNMSEDIGEKRNLINDHPDKAKSLLALLESYVKKGRSTPGEPQTNDAKIDIWKKARWQSPPGRKEKRQKPARRKPSGLGSESAVETGSSAQTDSTLRADDALPPFSWDRIPVYAHVGKSSDDFTPKELDFLAKHFDFLTIEKGQAARKYGNTEEGFAAAAREIKKRNPDAKVLFYWNASLDSSTVRWGYKAARTFPADGHLNDSQGQPVLRRKTVPNYDLRREDVRDWWSDAAATAVSEYEADGIFADAMGDPPKANQKTLDEETIHALRSARLALMEETRRKVAPDKLIVFNGLMRQNREKLLRVTDGAMDEHFGHFANGSSKEQIAEAIEAAQAAGREGKIVIIKAWPGFSYREPEMMKKPHDELAHLAKQRITFPLACFLVAAQPHSYFCYTWGYREKLGTFQWYPEFDKPLGPPRGDATRAGWTYQRDFAHASVFVDLETRTARIDWKR